MSVPESLKRIWSASLGMLQKGHERPLFTIEHHPAAVGYAGSAAAAAIATKPYGNVGLKSGRFIGTERSSVR